MLPRTISGIECDVVACGKIRPASATSPSAPLDPLTPGAQIQLKGAKAGTLGAFVRDADGDVCLISNCHVLSSDLASAGQPVYQPGVRYSGSRQIATVKNVAPISASDSNLVDVGLAKLDAGVQYQPAIPEIGALNGTGTPSLSEPVAKFGQATLDTLGDFVSIDADITVPFDFMTAHFANVYAFQPSTFADVGDSGSTIVEQRTGKAVGLLFAVGPLYKFAIPTQAIDGAFPGLTWL